MNVIDLEHGLVGCFGIVGGSIAAATGAALTAKRARAAWPSRSSATARPTRATSTSASTSPRSAPAGRVRLREQLLRRVHPDAQVTAGAGSPRAARPTACPRGSSTATTCWRSRGGGRGRRARPLRRRAEAARVPDLPPLRPLQVRPGDLPPEGRARALARARPADRRRARGSSRRASTDDQLDAAAERAQERARAGHEAALAAPYPDPEKRARHGVRRMRPTRPSSSSAPRSATRSPRRSSATRHVVFFGEDVAAAGGVFKATPGLHERFGDERVFDTPISELALRAPRSARAVTGLRPVFEVMFGDFMALPMDSLVNQSAKFWYISNEQGPVPLVVRSAVGGGGRFGAIHSQIPRTWFQGVPGLKIAAPSSPADAKGAAEGGDPRRQPGDLPRAQAALLGQGPGAGGRRRRAARRGERRARGLRPHARLGR